MAKQDDNQKLPKVTIRKETVGKAPNTSGNDLSTLDVKKVGEQSFGSPTQSSFEQFLEWLYNYLYFLGVYTKRKLLAFKRRVKNTFVRLPGHIYYVVSLVKRGFHSIGKRFRRWTQTYVRRIDRTFEEVQPSIDAARANKKTPWKAYRRIVWEWFYLIVRIMGSIFNVLIPVASLVVLLFVVQYYVQRPMGLQVIYQGEELGVVREEKDFNNALKGVKARIISDADNIPLTDTPTYQLVSVNADTDYTSQEVLEDGIIQVASDDIEQAYGVFVDGKLVGAVKDSQYVTTELKNIRLADATGDPDEEFGFDKPVRISQKGLYLTDSIMEDQALMDILTSNQLKTLQYTTQEGETVEEIATKVGMSLEDFIEFNPILATVSGTDELVSGTTLQYQIETPFLSVTHSYTTTFEREKAYEIIKTENEIFNKNYYFVSSAGVPGIELVTVRITTLDGVEMNRTVISSEKISDPIAEQVVVGVDRPQSLIYDGGTASNNGGFRWPTPNGGYISCDLWGYYNHSGIDIAGTGGVGTPVIAARAGTVTKAFNSGYNGGYGYYVQIDHGDGYTTLYAHNSQVVVSVGDYVEQGQLIAYVGMTGNTSGPHIHFEVRQNGSVLDPKAYVGSSPP